MKRGTEYKFDVLFNGKFNADNFVKGMNNIQSSAKKLNLSEGMQRSFSATIAEAKELSAEINALKNKKIQNPNDLAEIQTKYSQLNSILEKLSINIQKVSSKENLIFSGTKNVDTMNKKFQEELSNYKNYLTKRKQLVNEEQALNQKIKSAKETYSKEEQDKAKSFMDKYAVKDKKSLRKTGANGTANLNEVELASRQKQFEESSKIIAKTKEEAQAVKELKKALTDKQKVLATHSGKGEKIGGSLSEDFKKLFDEIKNSGSATDALTQKMNNANAAMVKLRTNKVDLTDKDLQTLGSLDVDIKGINDLNKVRTILNSLQSDFQESGSAADKFGNDLKDAECSVETLVNKQDGIANLRRRMLEFFGIENAVMVFKRLLVDAFNTVKELDAAMTETAVVTDFSVGDLWKEMPRNAKIANELGATIKGVYETNTLYYQQGLDTDQTMAISIETIKMARIAGMDYVEATDMMTAA